MARRDPQMGLHGCFPLLNPVTHKCPWERTAQEGWPALPAQELQGQRSNGLACLVLASSQAKGGSAHTEWIGLALG